MRALVVEQATEGEKLVRVVLKGMDTVGSHSRRDGVVEVMNFLNTNRLRTIQQPLLAA